MAIVDRMGRAVRGERALYEEVEHDPSATTEAMMVVGLVAIASGIGNAVGYLSTGRPTFAITALVAGVASLLIWWAVFSGVTYFIGSRIFNANATWEEVLRTLGYAYTPLVVAFLGGIPILGGLIITIAAIWTLYLVFVAIHSALDISGGKTIATVLLALIPAAIIAAVIQLPLAALAPPPR